MNPSTRHLIYSAVHLFLFKEGQVLLCRRANTGYEDGKFSVAAGHIDAGESATQAMIREAKEELGIEISLSDLECCHVMHRHTDRDAVDFFFRCQKWQGTPQIGEPEKCDFQLWALPNQLPTQTIPYVQKALELSLAGQIYSELGW